MNISVRPANVLATRAMIAYLSISQWTGRRLDREVTDELNHDKGAKANASRVNKLLLPEDALSPIQSIVSATRNEFLRRTMPWVNDGGRILPAVAFKEIAEWVRGEKSKFADAVDAFVLEYPRYMQQARNDLGSMFKAADYPTAREIADKFSMDLRVMPVPSGKDFRVDVAGAELAEMREEVERSVERATQDAMKSVYGRIIDVTSKMIERLSATASASGRKPALHASVVTNVIDLVAILPSLNITQDERLSDLTQRLEALTKTTPKELRESDKARESVKAEAKRILDIVSDWQ